MAFDLKEFKTNLQETVERHGRDVDLLLVASMLMGEADVQELFRKNNVDLDKLRKGLKLETQQNDAARKRKEKADEEDMDAHEYEKKKLDRWVEKANDEGLHQFIAAVELRAALEDRPATAVDVIKE